MIAALDADVRTRRIGSQMSDDVDFMMLANSLDRDVPRQAAVLHGLKRCLLVTVAGLGLLALAVLLVLTDTVAVTITLAAVAMVIFELCRRGMVAQGPVEKPGGRLG